MISTESNSSSNKFSKKEIDFTKSSMYLLENGPLSFLTDFVESGLSSSSHSIH
jgi:hypothetical protein